MSTAICPTCEKELDPARAPIARIRDGHVLTFCSAACAEGKPVVRAEETPVRAEETASSKAWYDKADEAIAAATEGDVDALWDDSDADDGAAAEAADAAPEAASLPRGYTWDDRSAPADADAASEPSRERKRPLTKAHVLMLAGAILVFGMVIAIIEAVSPSTPSTAAAGVDARAAHTAEAEAVEAEAEPAQDAALDRGKLAAAAVDVLRELMKSESPRIVRDAALALSRTGDAAALELLGERLKSEPSPLARARA